MRSFLLLLTTALVLTGAFLLYWVLQPASKAVQGITKSESIAPPLRPTAQLRQIRPGTDAWFKEFDENTGALVRMFRATEYLPQPNGTVLVKKPEAWFYSPNHQEMHLVGEDGEIVLKNVPDLSATGSAGKDNAPPAPPSRGRINHVTIYLTDPNPKNDLVMTTNNVQFDNDTLLITTESFMDDGGKEVPADQVPVHVEGNYKFDGRGLTMRWNDKDGRLEMLEVAHGEQLEIDDASGMSGFPLGGGSGRAAPVPSTRPTTALSPNVLPVALAAANKSATGEAIRASRQPSTRRAAKAARPAHAPAPPTPYLATFYDNVTVTQGELALATADRMEIQFMTKQDAGKASTQPATARSQTGNSATSTEAGTRPSAVAAPAPATMPTTPFAVVESQPAATTHPTTRPAEPPVIVRWTGKLTIVPTPAAQRVAVADGSAVIALIGRPAAILRTDPSTHERDDIRGARIVYHTADSSSSLSNSREFPDVILKKFAAGKTEPSSTIITDGIDFIAGAHVANLTGHGHVVAPADESAPQKGNLEVNWERGGRVYLLDNGRNANNFVIRQLDIAGNVDVQHPQLSLQSQALSLFFDPAANKGGATSRPSVVDSAARASTPAPGTPLEGQGGRMQASAVLPASQPTSRRASRTGGGDHPQMELRRVLATTDVWCQLTDAQGHKQTVEGDRLELLSDKSSNGQFQPHQVNADGAVHAHDDQQDLRAGHVMLTLRPATKPAVEHKPANHAPATRPSDTGGINASQVELEQMHASDHVIVTRADGSVASGDALDVTTENNEPHIRLAGVPARVVDAKQTEITGPLLLFQPKRQQGQIQGVGSLVTVADDADPNSRPAKVTWQQRANFNGQANAIDAFGGVTFNTIDKDGSLVTGSGSRAHIDLQDKPQPPMTRTASTTRPAHPATRPASSDAMADSMKMDTMGSKEMKAVTLDGDAYVDSTLSDEQGKILRRMHLEGPTLIYHIAGTPEQPARSLLVPAEGRMLISDHMPTDKRTPRDAGSGVEGGRGDTGFHWHDHMLYSEDQHRAVMTGNVEIAYKPEGQLQKVMINADRVTAEFEPNTPGNSANRATGTTRPKVLPATRSAASTRPANAPAEMGGLATGSMHLRNVQAQGHVVVTRNGARLMAQRIDYDPLTHWLLARGTADHPATFQNADGTESAAADEIDWNTQTWNIRTTNTSVLGKGR